MTEGCSRRRLLAAAAIGLVTPWGTSRIGRAQPPAPDDRFDPARHGFGFRNWTPATQYFEAPPDPTLSSIVEEIRTTWRDPAGSVLDLDMAGLSRRALEAIAVPLRLAITQRAGTNGHCYGMSLTAQRYFEAPSTIPVDRPVASAIEHPTVPLDDPRAPVYETIHRTQADQFLRFQSWVARRAMLTPDWIDLAAVLRDVESVVSTLGSASLMVFDRRLFGHQVLAYDVQEDGDTVRVPIYDPNRTALAYQQKRSVLRFTRTDGSVTMEPYGQYTHLLFNRYDRIEQSTDRDQPSPLEHVRVDRSTLADALFPVVVVLSETVAAELTVTDPAGEELDRLRGTFMDRRRGDHARIRTAYGADPGTYRIGVFGTDGGPYELTALAADTDGVIVDETRSGAVEPGELHTYELTVPADAAGALGRVDREWLRPALVAGGAAGAMAVGAIGNHVVQRLRARGD